MNPKQNFIYKLPDLKLKLIWRLCSVILVPQSGKCLFLESAGIQVYLSRFPLTIGIRNPSKNPSSTDNESGIHYLESEIHSVEYRIQECLGLSYLILHEGFCRIWAKF